MKNTYKLAAAFWLSLLFCASCTGSGDLTVQEPTPIERPDHLVTPQVRTQIVVPTTTVFDWDSVRDAVVVLEEYVEAITPTTTAPAPAPQPAPAAVVVAPAEIEALILEFFPGNETWARRVAECESQFNASAVNGSSGTRGVWQIHPGWAGLSSWTGGYDYDEAGNKIPLVTALGYSWDDMFNPRANAHVASVILNRSGAGQWSCK